MAKYMLKSGLSHVWFTFLYHLNKNIHRSRNKMKILKQELKNCIFIHFLVSHTVFNVFFNVSEKPNVVFTCFEK